ncbi:DUF1775 domain-containing protein [Streptomyces sp. Da 82-17]|uniref:DUF1775 domain-containing protein n=1 Tax=Streptomyces sp. Da 82-17 TaxID=3377116 RepID=UPI0038D45FC1
MASATAAPWAAVLPAAVALFVVALPLTRRPVLPLPAALAATCAGQLALHAWFVRASAPPGPHAAHAGHSSSYDGSAMVAAHAGVALLTAWLLHRADAACRTVVRLAAGVARSVAGVWGGWRTAGGEEGAAAAAAAPRPERSRSAVALLLLSHDVARRGPPGHGSRAAAQGRPRPAPTTHREFPVHRNISTSTPTGTRTRRTAPRLAGATALALATVLAAAPTAHAHVEVEADGARALDQNVTLSFSAASESDKAGISKLEVILPKGLKPGDVTYKSGPDGWKLAPTDRGYTVSGPAAPTGRSVTYAVAVRQLPDARTLAFKTLQTYDDGRVDRWIELEEPGGHDHSGDAGGHGNPAPLLKLAAAAPGAEPVAPSSSAPAADAPTPTTEPTPAGKADETAEAKAGAEAGEQGAQDDGDGSLVVPLAIGAVVLVAVGGAVWAFRRRSSNA